MALAAISVSRDPDRPVVNTRASKTGRFQLRALFIVVVVVITVSVVVLVMISIMVVAIVVVVPVVIVLNTAAISFPVTHIVPFAVVVRSNPVSSIVGRSSPISFMPLVMLSHGIPITLHPHELRSWPLWHNQNRSGWRWRGNRDANGYLRVDHRARG